MPSFFRGHIALSFVVAFLLSNIHPLELITSYVPGSAGSLTSKNNYSLLKLSTMNKMLVAVFDNENKAFEGLSALNDLHDKGEQYFHPSLEKIDL